MWPWRTLRSQVAHLGGQPGPGAQLAGAGEATDVADLGDQRHRSEPADPGQGHQRLDPGVGLGQACDLAFQPGDRGGQGVQQPTAVLDDRPRDRWQLQGGQPRPPRTGPQDLVLTDATIGQHRMHPVLASGRQAHQGGPVTQQRPQIADLRRGDPGLGQQIGPQQLGQGGRVDLVVPAAWPRRSPCSGWGGPGAAPARALPAAPPTSPSRRRPRTPPGCPAQGRQGSAPAWPDRWGRCGCAAGRRRRPRWRSASACDARPCRRTYSCGPPSPSSLVPEAYGCRAEQGTGGPTYIASGRTRP
jgi:hypothetical protein